MARRPQIMREYRRAQCIARAIEHPDKSLEQQALKALPPCLRQVYRDLKHPPTPELMAKRFARRLETKAKRYLKRQLKALVKSGLSAAQKAPAA